MLHLPCKDDASKSGRRGIVKRGGARERLNFWQQVQREQAAGKYRPKYQVEATECRRARRESA
jgi:hypothetical protein